jgi:hypothetical protein
MKKQIIGYQVIDKFRSEMHPDMAGSFCIYSLEQAMEMIESTKQLIDRKYELLPIYEGDIEEPTLMF